jgi:hypothetical protein
MVNLAKIERGCNKPATNDERLHGFCSATISSGTSPSSWRPADLPVERPPRFHLVHRNFKKLLDRLGIAAQAQAKLRPMQGGPLPDELQQLIVYTAAIGSVAKQPDAARALFRHLTTPEAAELLELSGLDPPAS